MADSKEVKSVAKFVRIVADLIRGKSVTDALAILKFTPKRGAVLLNKVLRSAIANAENNFDNLVVSKCFVDEGPTLKRIHPRSRGQAFSIFKRTSHITVIVSNKEETEK